MNYHLRWSNCVLVRMQPVCVVCRAGCLAARLPSKPRSALLLRWRRWRFDDQSESRSHFLLCPLSSGCRDVKFDPSTAAAAPHTHRQTFTARVTLSECEWHSAKSAPPRLRIRFSTPTTKAGGAPTAGEPWRWPLWSCRRSGTPGTCSCAASVPCTSSPSSPSTCKFRVIYIGLKFKFIGKKWNFWLWIFYYVDTDVKSKVRGSCEI